MDERPVARPAAIPEADTDEPAVHAVGVGPGDPAYLTTRARTIVADADVVVGFESVLDVIRAETDARLFTCAYDDQSETLSAFADAVHAGDTGAAVLMGDPNVSGYQYLSRVERAVDGAVRVVPGISSVQIAASRARTPLEQSTVVSLHRRGSLAGAFDRLAATAEATHLIVLPRPYDWMPADVAGRLASAGVDGDRVALVFERLTLPDETVTRTTIGQLADADSPEFSDLSILVVRTPEPTPVTGRNPEERP
jgi:cobalt-precorrin-7 (C5)-methyltransferase